MMWMRQVFGLWFLTFVSDIKCNPLNVHNYAPAHDEYKPTDYSFSYGVKDVHSGDIKHQWEKKEGNVVKGQYSLVEPDGSVRIVDYSADDKSGFNAIVKHSGPFRHPSTDYSKKPTSHNEVILKQNEAKNEQPEIKYELEEEQKEPEYETKYEYLYPGQYASGYTSQIDTPDYKTEPDVTYGIQQQEGEAEYGLSDEKQGYGFIPHEEQAEESQRSTVRSVLKHHHVHAKEPSAIKPPKPVREKYENIRLLSQLPVDISLLKQSTLEQIIPVDVSVINPVEIDLRGKEHVKNKYEGTLQTHNAQNHKQIQPSYELSQQELNKYLENYYSNNKVNKPVMESGFQPIKSTSTTVTRKPTAPQNSRPAIPQTYKSNKKPVTTPGLTHYSTHKLPQNTNGNNKHSSRLPNIEYFRNVPLKMPYQYASQYSNELRPTRQVSRLYRSVNTNGFGRYAKHVNK